MGRSASLYSDCNNIFSFFFLNDPPHVLAKKSQLFQKSNNHTNQVEPFFWPQLIIHLQDVRILRLGAATAAKVDELNFKVPFIQRFLGLQVLEFQCGFGLQGSLNGTLFGGSKQ